MPQSSPRCSAKANSGGLAEYALGAVVAVGGKDFIGAADEEADFEIPRMAWRGPAIKLI